MVGKGPSLGQVLLPDCEGDIVKVADHHCLRVKSSNVCEESIQEIADAQAERECGQGVALVEAARAADMVGRIQGVRPLVDCRAVVPLSKDGGKVWYICAGRCVCAAAAGMLEGCRAVKCADRHLAFGCTGSEFDG
jgi:hypothetical protein